MKEKQDQFFLPNFCAVRSVFILCIGAQLIAFVLILATGDKLSESWDELGLLSVFVQWIALASAGTLCVLRRKLAKLPIVPSAVLAYLLVVFMTAVIAAFAQYFLIRIGYQWGTHPETVTQFVTRCVMISAIITFVALRYFYVQQQWKQRIELESQARVEALQAKIRPHFLFNSMNIIASLIRIKPQDAERAVEDLSDLFRATLRDPGSMVSLTEEWKLCENYLRLEALRLKNRLILDIDLSNVPKDAAIPMLTLQPLVENAIYHGIQPLPKGGTIKVTGHMVGNNIVIKLSNPVPTTNNDRTTGNKIAVANIGHRLNLLFGSQAKLDAEATEDAYEVKVTFPYMHSGI